MNSQIIRIFLCVFLFFEIASINMSCVSTKKAIYFYNVQDTIFYHPEAETDAVIQKNSILSIAISSLNPEASAIFNTTNNFVISSTTAVGSNAQAAGYLVNTDGFIELPILGNIKAAGLTKKQLKDNITKTILDKKLLINPIVNIRHLNFEVTVIGEVSHPTVITVPSEKISLIKAIGLAGDLTIFGKRENVLLIREEDGKKKTTRINLNSASFFNSPYYYLQPNDVVYVEPNKAKVASASRSQQLLPLILGSLSIIVVVLDRVKF
jgi:polysaccharide export outer membrane protein